MECTVCGTKLPAGAAFCTKCGAKQAAKAMTAAPQMQPGMQEAQTYTQQAEAPQPVRETAATQSAQQAGGWQPTYAYQTNAQNGSEDPAVQGMGAGTGSVAQQAGGAASAAGSIAGGILGNLRFVGFVLAVSASIPICWEQIGQFGIKLPFHLFTEITFIPILILAIVSYLLVGIKDCLSLIWRMMKSGFRFPLWPINFITGFCTLGLAWLVAWVLPVLITGIVLFKKR